MEATKKKTGLSEMDLTSGKIFWKIPLFGLPMAFTTILQLLYTTIDLYTVAQFGGGNNSMSAVGSNTALINLIVTFFVSLSLGANVVMAHARGANNKEFAGKILHTSIILALFTGILVGIIGYFTSHYMLIWMQTPDSILDKATQYLQIYFIGLPFLMIYNYGSQILRALGDSKRPLYILMISGAVNVAFDFWFVIGFKRDVAGVAWATVLSEVVSAILVILWLIFNKKGYVTLHIKELRMDKLSLKNILRVGVPSGLQGLGFCIPNVLIQSALYSITSYSINGVAISVDEIVAGSSASSTIENYVFAFIDGFACGCTAFVSQNYGAGKKENIRKCFFYSLIWMFILWGVCALICCVWPEAVLGVFITESEGVSFANAIVAGKERMMLMVLTYCIDGIMDISSAYLRGLKRAAIPAIATISGCVGCRILFLIFLFPLSYFHTVFWLFIVYPISWIIVDIIYIPLILMVEKKAFREMDQKIQ
jgi:putative MATE family efflux protein